MPPGVRDESSGGTKCISSYGGGASRGGARTGLPFTHRLPALGLCTPAPHSLKPCGVVRVCAPCGVYDKLIPKSARSSAVSLHSRFSLSRHTTHAGRHIILFLFILFTSTLRTTRGLPSIRVTSQAPRCHRSARVLLGPFLSRRLILRPIRLIDARYLGHQRVVGIRVGQQRADRKHNCGSTPPLRSGRGPRTGQSTRDWARAHGAGHGRRGTFRDGERRRPLSIQDVQADRSIAVHVRMVYAGGEGDLRRLERVVRGEVNVEEEDAALEGRIAGPHDRRLQECDRWKVTGRSGGCVKKGDQGHCGAAVARGRLVGDLPVEQVVTNGACTARRGRVLADVLQLLLDPL